MLIREQKKQSSGRASLSAALNSEANQVSEKVVEQSEEETSAQELISKVELFGEDSGGLYLLDQELSKRVYHEPDLDF